MSEFVTGGGMSFEELGRCKKPLNANGKRIRQELEASLVVHFLEEHYTPFDPIHGPPEEIAVDIVEAQFQALVNRVEIEIKKRNSTRRIRQDKAEAKIYNDVMSWGEGWS